MEERSNGAQASAALSALGIGSLWGWVFCVFPSVGSSSSLGAAMGTLSSPWIVALAVGTVASVAFIATSLRLPALSSASALRVYMLTGCVLQVSAFLFLWFQNGTPLAQWLVGVLAGIAVTLLWIPWGMYLAGQDVALVERSIVGALIIAALVCAIFLVDLPFLYITTYVVLPLLQLAAYLAIPMPNIEPSQPQQPESFASLVRHKPLGQILVECLIAYSLVSFSWETLRFHSAQAPFTSEILFLLGFLLAATALTLFSNHATRVNVTASVRWVLPLVALGVTYGAGQGPVLVGIGLLLTACAHASFEGVLRLQVVALAHRNDRARITVVAAGFTTITVGALAGTLVYILLSTLISNPMYIALIALAAMVCLGIPFFKQQPQSEESTPPRTQQEVCIAMAERFGLTPRETEILGFLLEGRSHPYIRDELVISKSTVDTHVRHIYAKTGVSSKQELISLGQTFASS